MSKEKLSNLMKYQAELKSKAESKELPAKHASGDGKAYRAFLANELRLVGLKIESLKMAGGK